ncbi:hypothetical protein A3K73_03040 [Candidatus Pacearchaeota archaeon RBG_13_36_9]|nr:MAG: hypothetical protein A3K73_03040 [Candidatus Pacearchaeota archaeon RBG_13_36_9]
MAGEIKRFCSICGKEFYAMSPQKKYCSPECRKAFFEQQLKIKEINKEVRLCKRCHNKPTITSATWYCQECNGLVLDEEYKKHLSRMKVSQNKYYHQMKNNPDYKDYRAKYIKNYIPIRYKKDKEFKVAMNLRNLLYQALKKYTKSGKTFSSSKYGIDFEELIEHLKPFPKDIENWHIDHIIPLSHFNLENPEEIKKAFTPENLQWLLASDNIKKGNRLDWGKKDTP